MSKSDEGEDKSQRMITGINCIQHFLSCGCLKELAYWVGPSPVAGIAGIAGIGHSSSRRGFGEHFDGSRMHHEHSVCTVLYAVHDAQIFKDCEGNTYPQYSYVGYLISI